MTCRIDKQPPGTVHQVVSSRSSGAYPALKKKTIKRKVGDTLVLLTCRGRPRMAPVMAKMRSPLPCEKSQNRAVGQLKVKSTGKRYTVRDGTVLTKCY